MRLTKFTSHAIRILIDCARAGDELTKVATLSSRLQITQQNVFKIVNLLAHAGFIEAVRGRNGGVKLAGPPSAIRIGDVVRATEVTHVEIEDHPLTASRRGREVNRVLDDALGAFIEVLDQHTIADMAKSQAPRSSPAGARRSRRSTPRAVSTKSAWRSRRPTHDEA
jgi:Rrf2 family nitric oxide-sensitive transcriptional repressor